MEGGDQSIGNGGSRWNPTKEQINMLEGLYKQGLRTPSAEQIQQITARLKEFGHIEGKNVFYWFQNHKARQRQKQKQEKNSAFFGRLYHSTSSPFAPYHNVVWTPYHVPVPVPTQADLAMYHHQHAQVQLPAAGGCFKRRLISPESVASQRYNHMMHGNKCEQETLELFPMHPTGILQAKNEGKKETGKNHEDQPFYDFFSGKLN